jgi:hypothetical protein
MDGIARRQKTYTTKYIPSSPSTLSIQQILDKPDNGSYCARYQGLRPAWSKGSEDSKSEQSSLFNTDNPADPAARNNVTLTHQRPQKFELLYKLLVSAVQIFIIIITIAMEIL